MAGAVSVGVDWKLAAVVAVAGGALILYADKRARDLAHAAGGAVASTAKAAGDAVNITSNKNLAARAANALTDATFGAGTSSREETLGEAIYAWINPDNYRKYMRGMR